MAWTTGNFQGKTAFEGGDPREAAGFYILIIVIIRKYNTSQDHVKRNSGVPGKVSGGILRLFPVFFRPFTARMRFEAGLPARNGASGVL